ncbi:MAG: DUF1552 domain-containing protein [Gemmatales bacterium]|nr:DUF1552 domain-containing protein [Gemmatales bacterium]MDW7993032.1 DUF1552 domain-containing protein [Gemmatales bacterium]
MTKRISRRTVLKGMGATIALPLLEAMIPIPSLAAPSTPKPVKRLAFFYVPNGIHMPAWTPTKLGRDFDLPYILEPLKPFKDDLLVLSGLTLDKARPNGDGPGDHARAMASFLTGVQARKTAGADIRAGISVDQVAAQHYGKQTRFASLELGCEPSRTSGNCDSGYSCAYSSTISWRGESTPLPKDINPRSVFDRLFGRGAGIGGAAKPDRQKSILDFVLDQAHELRRELGQNDQRKLDEYFTSVREIERRIQQAEKEAPQSVAGISRPAGIPQDYAEHIRLLCDLLVLAFQTDQTRIATMVFANEGSNRSYRFINIPEGHHDLSHHGRDPVKLDKIRAINRFHMEQFARFIGQLKAIQEGDGTLLDNCMIVYGSGIGDGNRHNHDDLPILLVGRGGGALKTGRHLRYPKETPLMNLYLVLLDQLGIHLEKFGDSNGRLPDLT